MLRGVVGSEAFQRGIRTYYQRHFNANATTADFRRAMEEAWGQDLGWFFEQWLYKPGTLELAGRWTYDAPSRQVRIALDQVQTDGSLFTMPLEVAIHYKGQAVPTVQKVQLNAKSNVFTLDVPSEPEDVLLDPNRWVLMNATFARGR
jgi:aminopeptidase N